MASPLYPDNNGELVAMSPPSNGYLDGVWERNCGWLWREAMVRAGDNVAAAEDLLQLTFEKYWRSYPTKQHAESALLRETLSSVAVDETRRETGQSNAISRRFWDLTREDVRRIISAAAGHPEEMRARRDAALLERAYGHGGSNLQLVGLDVGDVIKGGALEEPHHDGEHPPKVEEYSRPPSESMVRWLELHPSLKPDAPLFVLVESDQEVTVGTIQRMKSKDVVDVLEEAAKRAGVRLTRRVIVRVASDPDRLDAQHGVAGGEDALLDKLEFEKCMNSLSSRQQEACRHALQGMKYSEIAAVMGVSPQNARKLVERACRRIDDWYRGSSGEGAGS